MIAWLAAVVIVIVVVVVMALAPRLAAGRRVDEHSGELADRLAQLGHTLGLDAYGCRQVFGGRVHRLSGTFNRLRVDLEVQVSRRFDYIRLNVYFPQTLDQDLTILSDRKTAIRNWMLRQKEVTIGDEEFDRDFILLARHPGRLKALLSPAIQFQLTRLIDMADTVEVGDDAFFVYMPATSDASLVESLAKKTLETAERVYATAVQLGPSPSKVEASMYTQAGDDIYQRDDESSPSRSSDESGSSGSAADESADDMPA